MDELRSWLREFFGAVGVVALGLGTIAMAFGFALALFIPVAILIGVLGLDPPFWVAVAILGVLTLAVMVVGLRP